MQWLMMNLIGGLASFGGVAPGGVRDTEREATRSALLGLCAAALGLRRDEVERQREWANALQFAVRVDAGAQLMRDYHTAQAPVESALKGRPRQTRRDELRVPKDDLNTVLSDRYYYANYVATVGIHSGAAQRLDELAAALRRPKFVLYLGRKSCPLAWPLSPLQVEASDWVEALAAFDAQQKAQRNAHDLARSFDVWSVIERRWFERREHLHAIDAGLAAGELTDIRLHTRWDDPLDTAKRLFAPRQHQRAHQSVPSPQEQAP